MGTGGKYEFKKSKAEMPDTFNIMLEYPGGPTVLLVSSMANDTPVEHVLRGHKATLKFTRTGFTITPQREFAKDMQADHVPEARRRRHVGCTTAICRTPSAKTSR